MNSRYSRIRSLITRFSGFGCARRSFSSSMAPNTSARIDARSRESAPFASSVSRSAARGGASRRRAHAGPSMRASPHAGWWASFAAHLLRARRPPSLKRSEAAVGQTRRVEKVATMKKSTFISKKGKHRDQSTVLATKESSASANCFKFVPTGTATPRPPG